MGTLTCRLLPESVADGPHNMAADEVLLESALAGSASLRFYRWSPATLSLGYFQSHHLRRQDDRLAPLPFVRRPSGGATLVHHHEVTYALALPPGPAWQAGEPWLCRMHHIIAAALHELGVTVHVCSAQAKLSERPGILCFQHVTPGDVQIEGAKVVGSAQRRQRKALLQHGAILLAGSPFTPSLPGIQELSGRHVPPHAVSQAVLAAFMAATGWELGPADWTTAERQRIDELVANKYTADTWKCKR